MSRRDLLTDEERRALFGVPADHDALVRLYTLSRDDLELVHARRGDANRLGFAVQLALLRHPGFSTTDDTHTANLVAFMAAQIDVPASALADYGARALSGTEASIRARQRRKRIERVFGYLKRNLNLRSLKLRGLKGAA